MARKTKELTITAEGRDKGRTFVITEPSSDAAERIAMRFWMMFMRAATKVPEEKRKPIPPELAKSGMAGIAMLFSMDFSDVIPYVDVEQLQPLLTEMLQCVRYQHAPGHPLQAIMEGESCQIEEVATRMQLKMEAFELITGFSLVG